jgi:hypothetical protein
VRYDVLFADWSAWASDRGVNVLSLVSEPPAYDELLAEFLQVMYQDGAPKGDAGGVLSAVMDKSPRLKKQLPTSQRIVRAWDSLEPSELRTPWPVGLLQAICAIAFLTGHLDDAMAFYLAFHCLLRPGELTILTHRLLILPSIALMGMSHIGVVNVELPKTRRSGPRKQHVLVDDSLLLACLRRFLAGKPSGPRLFPSYASLRIRLQAYLRQLGLAADFVTLGGLRAGGATYHYFCFHDVLALQRRGRWQSFKSLDHYIQESAVVLTTLEWETLDSAGLIRRSAAKCGALFRAYAAGAAVV